MNNSFKPRTWMIICTLCLFVASAVPFFLNHWIIIIRNPCQTNYSEQFKSAKVLRKTLTLWYWKHNRWNHEDTSLVIPENKAALITYLLNRWFIMAEQESLIDQRVTVQSTALTQTEQEAIISFDRSPFESENSTYQKWMIIEGILKTLREASINIDSCYFRVHHQELVDFHLDFSNPWPVTGYLSS